LIITEHVSAFSPVSSLVKPTSLATLLAIYSKLTFVLSTLVSPRSTI